MWMGVFGAAIGLIVACSSNEIDGDRYASGGQCPAGEVCGSEAPEGLVFVGQIFYDELNDIRAFGPVVVGGDFELGFYAPGHVWVDDFTVDVDSRMSASESSGELGLYTDEDPEGWVKLTAVHPGKSKITIRNSHGDLLDSITIEVVALNEVQIENLDADGILVAGENNRLAMQLYGTTQEGTRVRAFGMDAQMVVNGVDVLPQEGKMWDCFVLNNAEPGETITVEAKVGNEVYTREFDVLDAAQAYGR